MGDGCWNGGKTVDPFLGDFMGMGGDATVEAQDSRKLVVHVYPGDDRLGFKWDSPPHPVLVREVAPGGWADQHEVKVGHKLVDIDGKDPASFFQPPMWGGSPDVPAKEAKDKLTKALKKRPPGGLSLTFEWPRQKKKKKNDGEKAT